MSEVSGVKENKQIQGIKKLAEVVSDPSSGDFATLLKSIITPDAENKISEEELFAGVIKERLMTLKGAETATKFGNLLEKNKQMLQKPDGFIPIEDAANKSLSRLKQTGAISAEEYDKIYAQSFSAAQLDANKDFLWDSRGGGSDVTIAMDTIDNALSSAQAMLKKFDAGGAVTAESVPETVSEVSSEVKPNGSYVDGAAGFLFKPISNGDGRLAVLLPDAFAHLVDSVVIKDANGKEIDRGISTGYGDAGVQEKFRFNRKGADYPKDIRVEVKLADGSSKSYLIPDPSKRYD